MPTILRPPWGAFPLAVLTLLAGSGAPGCHAGLPVGDRSAAETARVDHAALGTFQPVPTPASPPRPALTALRAAALVGTVPGAADDDGLGARYAVRPLRLPATAPGATATFDYEGGKRGWVTALPRQEVLTTPAYGHGRIFVGGGFASRRFFAFDAFDGELDWSLSAPDGGPSAAIVEDRWVVFNTESCTLFVADAETGELRWKRWLGDPLMSQPVTTDGLVLSAYPANGGHRFGAFRLADGEPVWDVPIPADVIQAPQVAGDDVFFATMDGSVHRVRARDGRVGFRRPVGASSAVWVAGDRMLLTRRVDRAGRPHEQAIVLDAGTGRVVHRADEHVPAPYLAGATRDRRLAAGQAGAWGAVPHGDHLGLRNVAAGWAFQGATPAVADGRAYAAIGGEIRARDVATGETVWRRRYREAGDAQALTPPAVVGSVLVFGTVDGQLFAADVDTGMVLFAYDVGEPIVFQPVVAQGWVYVATGKGRLVALEVGDPAVFDGWHMWGGNPQHGGLVDGAGRLSPALLASLARPGQGIVEVARFEGADPAAAEDATPPGAQVDTARREHDEGPAEVDGLPPLPLLRTEVNVVISGPVARVQVTQVFDNPHDRPIEARYLFPLPEQAAVDAMEMRFDGRVVRGRIRRRRAARETYETAREDGRRAALLEQQRPNLFAQRVANIPPKERIEVALAYVQLVPRRDGAYALRYPMVAAPRFDPRDPGAVLGPRDAVRAPDEVTIRVSLDAGLPLGDVSSPSHPITVARGARVGEAMVALDPRDGVADRDFVLRYELAGATPRATVLTDVGATARGAGHPEGHLTLLVEPPALPDDALAAVAPARDLVFLVDASSSMRGRPMDHARAIVEAAVGDLRSGDRVGVIAFSDGVRELPGGLRSASATTRREVAGFLAATPASGSTMMAPALAAALELLGGDDGGAPGRLPILVLLSDGFVGNEADVLGGLVRGLGDTRVFTVGLGPAPNGFLLRRAASIGRGQSLLPAMSDLPAATARRFGTLVDGPVLTDVEVDWGGLAVEDVYPRRLPDLFAGASLVLHARYRSGGTARVAVRGNWAGRRHERVIDVVLPEPAGAPDAPGRSLPPEHASLWARSAVRDRVDRGFLRPDPSLAEEIAALGLAYRLVTSETSFVAAEDAPRADADPGFGPDGDPRVEAATRTTVTPARALPGDPEIRIPAPSDARAVTVVLPFGETLSAAWEPDLGVWAARFLIPDDAREGSHPIDVLVTHRDGRLERLRTGYTVDASAPLMDIEVLAPAVPGGGCRIRATQRLSEADLRQAGFSPGAALTPARAALLEDVRRVEARVDGGDVVPLAVTGPRTWEATLPVPSDAGGAVTVEVFVADLAANVGRQTVEVPVVAASGVEVTGPEVAR